MTTHVRYDHYHYPREIDLLCPHCKNHSVAINENVPKEIEHFIDIANFEKIWDFKCIYCIKKYQVEWDDIQNMDLWYKINLKGVLIWAWNSKHLDMIIKKLKKEDIKNHSWVFFESYLNKNCLKKIKNKSDIGKLENMLKYRI